LAGEEKRRIARQAYVRIREGDTVYLDGGSTILELARLLRDRGDITVVTNSLRAATELAASGPRLILLGGEFRRRSQTVVGTLTRSLLETIYLDIAFMGTIGVTEEGLTTTDPNEAYTKQLVMTRAQQVVLLADSTKIGKVSFAHAGKPGDIGVMITDGGADPHFLKAMKKIGVTVEVVG
jgi:DeoR/GlpR family transcriptional regulator of sugar metabolism